LESIQGLEELNSSLHLKRYVGRGLLISSALIVVLVIAHYPDHVDEASTENTFLDRADYKAFYGANYYGSINPSRAFPVSGDKGTKSNEGYPYTALVSRFVRQYGLEKARILEVGAGRGALQDIVSDYTALEISSEQKRFFHKPFVAASATKMPFKDGEFDAIWTINVLEHVPMPEQALSEMRRVLKDKGLLYLQAAWQCRTWAAEGYQVRSYGEFDIQGRLIKASIPLRDSTAYRALYILPIRLLRLAERHASGVPTRFRYSLLAPNYEHYWQPDSDAVNSMDPYEAILWFTSRGDEILSYEGSIHSFFVRTGTILISINKHPH
jgi:SAM-dependent methyltransferase